MDNLETKLVSAKDLIDYCKHYIELYKGTQTDKARRDELYAVIGQIVNMPSAQPEAKDCWGCNCPKVERYFGTAERKKGRWKYIALMTAECSECHKQIHELEYDNFCPSCGADMRGEQDD